MFEITAQLEINPHFIKIQDHKIDLNHPNALDQLSLIAQDLSKITRKTSIAFKQCGISYNFNHYVRMIQKWITRLGLENQTVVTRHTTTIPHITIEIGDQATHYSWYSDTTHTHQIRTRLQFDNHSYYINDSYYQYNDLKPVIQQLKLCKILQSIPNTPETAKAAETLLYSKERSIAIIKRIKNNYEKKPS